MVFDDYDLHGMRLGEEGSDLKLGRGNDPEFISFIRIT
jgi:hypothetical protein